MTRPMLLAFYHHHKCGFMIYYEKLLLENLLAADTFPGSSFAANEEKLLGFPKAANEFPVQFRTNHSFQMQLLLLLLLLITK